MLAYALLLIPTLLLGLALLTLATIPGTARSVLVTDRGITGRPMCSPAVEIDWGDVGEVEVRRGLPAGMGLETVRVVARDGRRVVTFDEGIRLYEELKGLVLGRGRRG